MTFGVAVLAVIVADPAATPVIGTDTLVAFALMVTVPGTVAAPLLLDVRVMFKPPAGAGPDKFKVRFCVAPTPIESVDGEKLRFETT